MTSFDIIVYEGPYYSIRLEYTQSLAIVHLPHITKMTPSVYKDMSSRLQTWMVFLTTGTNYDRLWAAVSPDDKKINKLLRKLGFKFIKRADGMLVYSYGV